jgi:hypothetical protein
LQGRRKRALLRLDLLGRRAKGTRCVHSTPFWVQSVNMHTAFILLQDPHALETGAELEIGGGGGGLGAGTDDDEANVEVVRSEVLDQVSVTNISRPGQLSDHSFSTAGILAEYKATRS